MAQVFISHSSQDRQKTEAVVAYLEENGISCWVSYRDIPPGADFSDQIYESIEACPFFVLLLSGSSTVSVDVAKELTLAMRDPDRLILPLMIEDFPLPKKYGYHLANVQIYDHYAASEEVLEAILREIRQRLPDEAPVAQPAEATADECCQIAERLFRQGKYRDAAIWYSSAVERLRRQQPTPPPDNDPKPISDPQVEEWYQNGLERYRAKDYPEAVRWYQMAAEQGHASAQYNLGHAYEYGKGVPRDYNAAVNWYRKAAEQGHAGAQNNLGYAYEYRKGVPKDYNTAISWYCKAAEQGEAAAQNNLGYAYNYGHGVPKDLKTAIMWFRKAAEQGHAPAQNNLGYAYEYGHGVSKDGKSAEMWYLKAAEQGHSVAQFNLAMLYEDGGNNLKKDLAKAKKWYQKAADQGHKDAKDNLSSLKFRFVEAAE